MALPESAPAVRVPSVDVPPRGSGPAKSEKFVLIITNEKYDAMSEVAYAEHDGEIFGKYCRETLGTPEGNISVGKNTTAGQMRRFVRQFADRGARAKRQGRDVDFTTADGRSLLDLASGKQALCALLFDAKKSFTHEDLKSLIGARTVNVAQVKKVLNTGVKPDDADMYAAVKKNDAALPEALLSAGGNANAMRGDVPIIFPHRIAGTFRARSCSSITARTRISRCGFPGEPLIAIICAAARRRNF